MLGIDESFVRREKGIYEIDDRSVKREKREIPLRLGMEESFVKREKGRLYHGCWLLWLLLDL